MMTQYGYLRANKFEREVQFFISCNVLYIMTQYTYLRSNKFKHEVQIFISSNVLYMTTQYVYLGYNKFKGDTRWRFERYLTLAGREYCELGACVSRHSHFKSHAPPFHATRNIVYTAEVCSDNHTENWHHTVHMSSAPVILGSVRRMPCPSILLCAQYAGAHPGWTYLLNVSGQRQ